MRTLTILVLGHCDHGRSTFLADIINEISIISDRVVVASDHRGNHRSGVEILDRIRATRVVEFENHLPEPRIEILPEIDRRIQRLASNLRAKRANTRIKDSAATAPTTKFFSSYHRM